MRDFPKMHIKPADREAASAGASHSGRQLKEPTLVRKVRLGGGAARVPSNKETTESSLRVFVSAIGQSIGVRTPLRKHSTSTAVAKNEHAKSEPASCSTPAGTRRMANTAVALPEITSKHTTSARATVTASTPRRSSLSSSNYSSPSISSSTPLKKGSPSVTSSPFPRKFSSAYSSSGGSAARSSNNPTTPLARKTPTMPPRTPTAAVRAQINPTTPVSRYSSIPTPAKKQGLPLTPISMQATTPSVQKRQDNPTTPVAKRTSVYATTPVNGNNSARTPLSAHCSNIPFYTPKTTLPAKSSLPSPLQPRNVNLQPDSSRRLHFGINLSAMVEQENSGLHTPRAFSSTVDATYSFDKTRLAQIKARRHAFQKLLTSPAQRVRAPDSTHPALTPRRPQVEDIHSDPASDTGSPTRRRVANSLF